VGIEHESVVDHPIAEVFAWHTRPGRDDPAGAALAADEGGGRDAVAGRRAAMLGARELAEANQRVVPTRLQTLGHRFRRSTIVGALSHELGHG